MDVVQLRMRNECIFESKMDDDEGFLQMLRILVILFHLPTPGVWDRLKRTSEEKRSKPQLRQKMPLTNSLLLLLRHTLHFVCFMRRRTKGEGVSNKAVTYPVSEKIMQIMQQYAEGRAPS